MKKIKLLRLCENLTQIDLSTASGVPVSRISLIECGHVRPTNRELSDLAHALRVEKKALEGELKSWRDFISVG